MSPRTPHNGLPVALALCALATLATLSGCTYVEKNYYYGDLDTGAEPGEPADSGGADSAEPEPPAPIERVWSGFYEVDDGGGSPLQPPIRLGMTVGADGDEWGTLRTIESQTTGGVVLVGFTVDLRVELMGTIDAAGVAAGSAVNRPFPEGEAVGVPQPWATTVLREEGAPPRLDISGEAIVVLFGSEQLYPFTAELELQPLE